MKRRTLIIGTVLLIAGTLWSCNRDKRTELIEISASTMPHDRVNHERTWLTFSGSQTLKQNIILIASAIAQYEPVAILVNKDEKIALKELLGNLNTHHYPIEIFQSKVHTPWTRNNGPAFVFDEKKSLLAIDFKYPLLATEEKKDIPLIDDNSTQFIASKASAKVVHSNLVVKVGCIEIDGAGMAIITEQCIVNDIYNPYWKKEEIETELKVLLGVKKIIWIKGLAFNENKNATALYARFTEEGNILVHRNNNKSSNEYALSRENIGILQTEKDAQGHPLKMIIVDGPKGSNKNYLGYYLVNNALIMQTFGDPHADYKAQRTFQLSFPKRSIEALEIDAINTKGKDIHSITLQEPKGLN